MLALNTVSAVTITSDATCTTCGRTGTVIAHPEVRGGLPHCATCLELMAAGWLPPVGSGAGRGPQ